MAAPSGRDPLPVHGLPGIQVRGARPRARSRCLRLPVPLTMSARAEQRRRHRANLRHRVWNKTGGCCWVCWRPVTFKAMTLDHVVPKSRGGVTAWINLMPAHGRCNRERGNRPPPPSAVHPLATVRPPKGVRWPPLSTDEAIAAQKRDEELPMPTR